MNTKALSTILIHLAINAFTVVLLFWVIQPERGRDRTKTIAILIFYALNALVLLIRLMRICAYGQTYIKGVLTSSLFIFGSYQLGRIIVAVLFGDKITLEAFFSDGIMFLIWMILGYSGVISAFTRSKANPEIESNESLLDDEAQN